MIELAKQSPEHDASLSKEAVAKTMAVSIWRNRTFLAVFASYSLSLLGNTFHSIALNLWTLQTTGSAKLMSLVLITHLVVSMLLGPIAGTIADRVNRRKLMWATDLFRFVIVALIALFMNIPGIPFAFILILTALVAIAGSFRTPAFQASLVEVVGKSGVTQAVAAISVSDNMVRIGGFAAGGIAVAAFGGPFAVAIDATTFLISGILLLLAGKFPFQQQERLNEAMPSFRSDFTEGLRTVWQNRFIRGAVLLLPIVMFFFLSTFMLIQVMAVQVWNASPFIFGLLEACIPLGYVVGSLFIMKFDNQLKRRGVWMLGSIVLLGPCFILIAQSASAVWALPLIMLVGLLFSFSTTIISIILRITIEPELQGRVFGLLGTMTSIAPPLGLAIFSVLSDRYGPAIVITFSGIAMLAASLLAAMTMKSIRHLN